MELATGHEQQRSKLSRRMADREPSFSKLVALAGNRVDSNSDLSKFADYFSSKVSHHESGRNMMSSEFISMTLIRNTVPDLAPLPIAWGTYAADSDIHFYLSSFHDMKDDVPEIQPLAAKTAELHEKGLSPNGKYGFSVPTCQGKWPQPVEWKESWEEFFLLSLKWILEQEEESQGYDAE